MEWTTPTFEEIPMNAEIGGYFPDDAERPASPVAREDASEVAEASRV